MLEAGALLGVWGVGLLAGLASGFFGVGGGILIVPAALYLVPGTGFHEAKAASLLVIVASAPAGIWAHRRAGAVSFRDGVILASSGLVAAAGGGWVAEAVPDRALMVVFAALLGVAGARIAGGADPAARALSGRGRDAFLVLVGVVAGTLAGALGVGGGVVMVPGLLVAGAGIHLAIGTSLVAVFGNALGGTMAHLALGYGPTLLAIGVPLALGAIPGTYAGATLAARVRAQRLQRVFGGFLLFVAAWLLVDAAFP